MISDGNIKDAENSADEFDKALIFGTIEVLRRLRARTSGAGVPFHSEMSDTDAVGYFANWLLRRDIHALQGDIRQVHDDTRTLDGDVKEVHVATEEVDTAVEGLKASSLHLERLTRRLVWLTLVLTIATIAQVLLVFIRIV